MVRRIGDGALEFFLKIHIYNLALTIQHSGSFHVPAIRWRKWVSYGSYISIQQDPVHP
jgi:hypothetical protein